MRTLEYYHVDVFSDKRFSGNGLTVFTDASTLTSDEMLMITREMRQFESVFLSSFSGNEIKARVFTVEEELDFAGHPVLGASAVLHWLYATDDSHKTWRFHLNKSAVTIETVIRNSKKGVSHENISATMNQEVPEFGAILDDAATDHILKSLNLNAADLVDGHHPQMVSTGLPYLVLPLATNAAKAKIVVHNLEEILSNYGAKFIGILDLPSFAIRTWNNSGTLEDVATGSLAGPVGAWLVANGYKKYNEKFILNQGENLGRPSRLFVQVNKGVNGEVNVYVGGDVVYVGKGTLSLS